MSENQFLIKAFWDNEASVWVATSDDIPGLVTEASTDQELIDKLKIMIPELLSANNKLPESAEVSFSVNLSQRTETVYREAC